MIEVHARLLRVLCSFGLQSCTFWCTITTPLGYPFGEGEGEKMRWYNPNRRVAESVLAPYTDEEAEDMLRGATDSWAFLMEYERLRGEGMDVEPALLFVGHLFGSRHPWHRPVGWLMGGCAREQRRT